MIRVTDIKKGENKMRRGSRLKCHEDEIEEF